MKKLASSAICVALLCCFFIGGAWSAFPKPAENVTLSAANGGQWANVRYFHQALWNIAGIDYPASYDGSLDAGINMEYLLNAIDAVNYHFSGVPITEYGSTDYATQQAVPKAAVDYAIENYIKNDIIKSEESINFTNSFCGNREIPEPIWSQNILLFNFTDSPAMSFKFVNGTLVGMNDNSLCFHFEGSINDDGSVETKNSPCYQINTGSSPVFNDIAYGNGTYVGVGNSGIWVSTDMVTWNQVLGGMSLFSITFVNALGLFIASRGDTIMLSSGSPSNPSSWVTYPSLFMPASMPPGAWWTSTAYGEKDNKYQISVTISQEGYVMYSSNATDIIIQNIGHALAPLNPSNSLYIPDPSKGAWTNVVFGAGRFFAFSNSGYIVSSTDGLNWSSLQLVVNNTNLPDYSGGSCNSTATLSDVELSNLSVGPGSTFLINYYSNSNPTNCNGVYLSMNGINWIPIKANKPSFHNAAIGNKGFIMAAGPSSIYSYIGQVKGWKCSYSRPETQFDGPWW